MINYTSQKVTKALGLIVLSTLGSFSFAQNSPSSFNWSQAGPVYNAGRSRNMVIDQRDASHNTFYTGSVSSGVYKTTDGGVNWRPMDSLATVLNISYMAQDKFNNVYASTGEGFLRPGQQAKAQKGTGLYYLTSASQVALVQVPGADSGTVGNVINRIACSPVGDVIALATNKGIMVGTSGGNFQLVKAAPAFGMGQDVKFDMAGTLYCSLGSAVNYLASSPDTKIYRSQSNNNYQVLSDITPTASAFLDMKYGRTELAIAPSNSNVIYASIANKAPNPVGDNASLRGLFVSYDAGNNWGLVQLGGGSIDALTNGADMSSGDYSQVVVVFPNNYNAILWGGYSCYLWDRYGGSDQSPLGYWSQEGSSFFLNTPFYLHENIHDIKIVGSGTTALYYFVTDAGIYRSSDLSSGFGASFQPFYKGLVTGQFNSVSIESFTTSVNSATAPPNQAILANDGFSGGTDGNGLTYFSGQYPLASQETSYLTGEVGKVEYSKILPEALFVSAGSDGYGATYRSSDIRTAYPTLLSVNSYSGTLSKVTPEVGAFYNPGGYITSKYVTSGTVFNLWENYGQVKVSPDSLVFYNDSITVKTSIVGLATLTTQTTFTFSPGRPNKFALIDSIAIRTGTVVNELTNAQVTTSFTPSDRKDIFIKLQNNYPINPSITTPSISSMIGPVSAAGVTLNATTGLDLISVTFTSPAFATKTIQSYSGVSDPSIFYKVFATIFYKYSANIDTITIIDNSISTKALAYSFPLAQDLRWSRTATNGTKPLAQPTNPPQKIAAKMSARLAMAYSGVATANQIAIVVSKSPLNLNDPLSLIRISQSGALTTDSNGAPTQFTTAVVGHPTLIEWSHGGTELYYATDANKVYRVSYLNSIMDLSPASYSGKLSTDIFTYNSLNTTTPLQSTVPNPNSPYRTTLLGSFTKPITSIAITNDDSSMGLTFADPTGTIVRYSGGDIRKCDTSNINFSSKTSNLSNITTYCSMMEKDDNKQFFIGTDQGVYYTQDITAASPSWNNINNGQLPKIRVLDMEQQTLDASECYNSGQIFVATYGRGVWTNKKYYAPNVVSVQELSAPKTENNLKIYPNPTTGKVYVSFSNISGETAIIQVMDINGRLVKSESLGKLPSGETNYAFETSDVSAGMYIVNIHSDAGIRRVSKLVVTK